jgi:hypothetical protein
VLGPGGRPCPSPFGKPDALSDTSHLEQLGPRERPRPPLPAPVGFGIEVSSLAATRTYLAGQGIAFRDGQENGVWIHAKDACDTVLYFFGCPR